MSYRNRFDYDEEFVAISADLGRAVEDLRNVRYELNSTYMTLGDRRMQMRMQGLETAELDEKISEVSRAIRDVGDKIDSTLSAHLNHLQACQVGYTDQ
mgnify:CR=1 FL=1